MSDQKNQNVYGTLMWAASLGIVLVVSTAAGLAIGLWLDTKAGTKPFLTALFFILGIAAGFRQILKEIKSSNDEQNKK